MKKLKLFICIVITFFLSACNSEFNQELWENDIDSRKGMVADLVDNILVNKTEEDIILILGIPDSIYFKMLI